MPRASTVRPCIKGKWNFLEVGEVTVVTVTLSCARQLHRAVDQVPINPTTSILDLINLPSHFEVDLLTFSSSFEQDVVSTGEITVDEICVSCVSTVL